MGDEAETEYVTPPLPPGVDPLLWLDAGDCGRHFLARGRSHTRRGAMVAWCPEEGRYTSATMAELAVCSEQARYYARGFLSGNEPDWPVAEDGDDMTVDHPLWDRWWAAVDWFHQTGRWEPPTVGPAPAPLWADDDSVDDDEAAEKEAAVRAAAPVPDPALREAIEELVSHAETVGVAMVVDVPHADAPTAVDLARGLADRVSRKVVHDDSAAAVGGAVQVTRVWLLLGSTPRRPRSAIEQAVTALGRSGWTRPTAREGEKYVTAAWHAERRGNTLLDRLGPAAVELHAGEGLGLWPSQTPGSWLLSAPDGPPDGDRPVRS
ncbi:MAG TPA: hypothetical protein VES42_29220 [Pilimelia sp.]|nr:hypothetical protein [Pilimelia sp.]